jgi:uncharacterized membrane protein YgaE (UPF0421/DUF939 family)
MLATTASTMARIKKAPNMRRLEGRNIRDTIARSVGLALACLVSSWLVVEILGRVHSISKADDMLGAMWAVIATVFVYRDTFEDSATAALSRMAATLVSFALCLAYLLILPFTFVGMAALIGLGNIVAVLGRRPGDAVTIGITTAVVMVVAALNPVNAWEQPILRLIDTVVGVAVGVTAARVTGALRDWRLRRSQ